MQLKKRWFERPRPPTCHPITILRNIFYLLFFLFLDSLWFCLGVRQGGEFELPYSQLHWTRERGGCKEMDEVSFSLITFNFPTLLLCKTIYQILFFGLFTHHLNYYPTWANGVLNTRISKKYLRHYNFTLHQSAKLKWFWLGIYLLWMSFCDL